MSKRVVAFSALVGLCMLTGPALAQTRKVSRAEGIAFFEKKIRPVLVQSCYKCHSQESRRSRGGLMLDTRDNMRMGGDTGHGVVPKNLKSSLVWEAITYKNPDMKMPPDKKLPESVLADFRKWIEMGAPDPRDGKQKKVAANSWETAKDLWSLQPVKKQESPEVANAKWPLCGLDHFVLAELEERNLQPAGDAKPLALLRRVHYDLVGLPPSPETVQGFVADPTRRHYEKIVDDLLASPQFGERWGRHWLDVARFAESNGLDRDVLFPHAWRYRRYVIDAFNKDIPYDQFVTEQIAGDLLSADSKEEEDRLAIATGFLALGPKPFSTRGKRFEMDVIDDQIDTTSRSVLALTVSCARCHDHKFDPIPTKDYYSLASIFASTKTLYGSNKKNNSNLQIIGNKSAAGIKQAKTYQKELAKLNTKIKNATRQVRRLQQGRMKRGGTLQKAQKQLRDLRVALKKLKKNGSFPAKYCMSVTEQKTPTDLRVFVRGQLNKQGEAAPRGFLSAIELDKDIKVNSKQSGRLELAKWLTDPSNPLTARVAVNRIWHHLFGQGIVRTVDNFGKNGEKPSHPELLDYLADRFIANGWSTKKMIREIVLSRTYQLASEYNAKNYEVDPDNTFLWRRALRRLDIEAIRDTILHASGKLDTKQPKQSLVVRMGFGEVGRGINTKPLKEEFNHRSVYLPILRTDLLEVLKLFDFAEPSLVVGSRTVTTVPAQALYMMNSPFVIGQAKTMAKRLMKETMSDSDRVELAYQLALARMPKDGEQKRVLDYLDAVDQRLAQQYSQADQRREMAWTTFCQALFASAEFRYQN
ncbi:MAG: DUF1553 domain-containing protein [Gemmataceae bacterium]